MDTREHYKGSSSPQNSEEEKRDQRWALRGMKGEVEVEIVSFQKYYWRCMFLALKHTSVYKAYGTLNIVRFKVHIQTLILN